MGVPPKGRAERPALRAAAKTLAFLPLSALLFLPLLCSAPKRGGLGPRASSLALLYGNP